MKSIIIASSNPGKIKEFSSLLSPIEVIPQKAFNINSPNETGLSFIENAILKARHASEISGLPALADDSGLVVPILEGAPGIFSARFAGADASDADNMHLLLKKMEHLNKSQRSAFFFCAIVIVKTPFDPMPLVATGHIRGEIHSSPAGTEGFGYDPVFYLSEYQCTMAQLPADRKNLISHRAQALKALKKQLSL